MALNSLIHRIRGKSNAVDVFNRIYHKRSWNGRESVSGRGSDLDQTRVLRERLPNVIRDLEIHSMLDLPCGDFNWMSHVISAVPNLDYLGGDIVGDLIDLNNSRYSNSRTKFRKIDLITNVPPSADLLVCRDCLVHLSFNDIEKVLCNIAASNYKYVAFTSFDKVRSNKDIVTGAWRPLNLCAAPFNLPLPEVSINEQCTESNGKYRDKNLAIFKFSELF